MTRLTKSCNKGIKSIKRSKLSMNNFALNNFRTLKFENESSLKERSRLSVASKKASDSKQKAADEVIEFYKL